ncbi:MAG TPA: YebC/PmpR family DNA-binding transcriptional regulator [Bdellovibrionota bacterium]|jgi:YebC/PmpR family DNA-binding regulatory protein|nr:YebC/PmpR family DNA-binding transcriptional regulator [Bdellovibrionota bacterium]
MGRGWVHGVRVASAAKKGKAFTKIAKEITVAVKLGGGDAEGNPRLRTALREAQKNSMPKDTVDRAIKRGLGATDEAALEEIIYEGYAPHGVAFLVEVLTDNRNRSIQDLRAIVTRKSGNMGEPGSVLWMFDRLASVLATKAGATLDTAEEAAINAGANEVQDLGEGHWHFWADMTEMDAVSKSLVEQGWTVEKSELSYKPKTPMELSETQEADVQVFLDAVDDHDDVKRVFLAL